MKSTRVLLVEDNQADARLVLEQLAGQPDHRFAVDHVDGLSQAVQRMKANSVDVVLLDLGLPGSRDLDTLTALQPWSKHVPIVVLTETADEQLATQAVREGAQDYLVKGELNGADLTRTLRHAIERKLAERALEESEERFKLLFEYAPDAYHLNDLDGRFVDCNRAAEELTGYKRHELIGKNLGQSQLFSPDQLPRAARELTLTTLGEPTGPTEFVLTSKDGTKATVEIRAFLVQIRDRHLVLGIARDITRRRQAENAVRQSEKRYRELVEGATFGICHSTFDGKFLSVNRALVEMLGYDSAEELMGVDIGQDIYGDQTDRLRRLHQTVGLDFIQDLELVWKRRDGQKIIVRNNGRVVRSASGEVEGFDMVVEDVTERKELEGQLRQAQKVEAIGQLTSGIAHDFNNLLSVILINSEVIRSSVESGVPVSLEDIKDVESAALKASAMTKKLLGLSRRADLHMVSSDLAQVSQDLLSMLRRVLPETIDVQITSDQSPSVVDADAGAVEQVLLNLATNARDAMPDGGRLTIDLSGVELDQTYVATRPWARRGRFCCIAVSDTGTGMNGETKERLFEPFFTTKEVGAGTGLGMAMVYGLVKQHDGYVDVHSELGVGTTIRLYFPLKSATVCGPSEDQAEPENHGGSETILIVEDEESLRHVGRRVLEKHGYSMLAAADGVEGLVKYRAHADEIDLVISDLVMPNLGGAELLEAIRKEWGPVRFLLASGYSDQEARERCGVDAATPFLQKPWSLNGLLTQVRDILDSPIAGVAQGEESDD